MATTSKSAFPKKAAKCESDSPMKGSVKDAPQSSVLNLTIAFTFMVGIVLTPIGIGLLRVDTTVTHVEDYSVCQGTDVERACVATVVTRGSEHYPECDCRLNFELNQPITGDVTMYHSDQACSRDESQLRDEPGAAPALICDTFSPLKAEHEAEPYAVAYSELLEEEATSASEVWDSKPKSGLSEKNVWDSGSIVTGVVNEALQAWMDTSLKRKPVFHVLRDGLPAGKYSIDIHIRSSLTKDGSKKLVFEGLSPRAQAGYALAGTIMLVEGIGALLICVLLLVIALKRGYYVANIRAVLDTVAGAVRDSYESSFLRQVRIVRLIGGMVLLLMSIGFFATAHTTVKTIHIVDYSECHGTDVERACVAHVTSNNTECNCTLSFELNQPIIGEVTLYHKTDQTDAAYARSRDDRQRGEPGAAPAHSCVKIDSFSSLKLDDESKPIVVSYTGLLPRVTGYYTVNPPEDDWNKYVKPKSQQSRKYNTSDSGSHLTGVENEAYRAWMDPSLKPTPIFSVVDPALPGGLPAGNYSILIHINCFSEHGSNEFALEGVLVPLVQRLIHVAIGAVALVAGMVVLFYETLLFKKNHSACRNDRVSLV